LKAFAKNKRLALQVGRFLPKIKSYKRI